MADVEEGKAPVVGDWGAGWVGAWVGGACFSEVEMGKGQVADDEAGRHRVGGSPAGINGWMG